MKTPALEKGLDILECLASAARPLSLSQIARELGRNVSEIQRMVRALHRRGYLDRNEQSGYSLGFKVYTLGRHFWPFRHLQQTAEPILRQTAEEMGKSVHVSAAYQGRMLILSEALGSDPVCVSVREGTTHPLEETVSGRILLSQTTLPEEGKALARKGYLLSESRTHPGVFDLGVPVRNHDGTLIAALTSNWLYRKGRESKQAVVRHVSTTLRASAERLEKKLSDPEEPVD